MPLLLSAALAAALSTPPGEVEIRMSGLSPTGDVYIQLCGAGENIMGRCARGEIVKPGADGTASVRFSGVPAGRWAAGGFQDVDGDRRMSFGAMGPSEPWGFSGRPAMGPPSFDSAAVDVPASGAVITLAFRQ